MRPWEASKNISWAVCFLLSGLLWPSDIDAATAQTIDAGADKTLVQFRSHVKGAEVLLRDAKGVLVFPEIIQVGIGIGGQYGEGVLRFGGQSLAYYNLAAVSIGLQLGAQRKSIVVVFLQDEALQGFREKTRTDNAWNVGVDGSVALLRLGAQASIDSATFNQPIVGVVFGQQGLMYNLSLQGAKVSRLER